MRIYKETHPSWIAAFVEHSRMHGVRPDAPDGLLGDAESEEDCAIAATTAKALMISSLDNMEDGCFFFQTSGAIFYGVRERRRRRAVVME